MSKLIQIRDLKSLKRGDIIVYNGGDVLGLHNYTKNKEYKIIDFYENQYGIILINDTGEKAQVCSSNVCNYFNLLADSTNNPPVENRVLHPSHYTWLKKLCGIEVIDITRHMNFNLGNTLKYILRSGHKSEQGMSNKQKQIEDLKKARFYIDDEIKRLENE